MDCNKFKQAYLNWLNEGIHCELLGEGRIQFYHPYYRYDREGIEIEILYEGDKARLSDLGEMDGFLFTNGINLGELTTDQQRIVDHVLLIYGIKSNEKSGSFIFTKELEKETIYHGVSDFLFGLSTLSDIIITLQPKKGLEFYRIVYSILELRIPDILPRKRISVKDVQVTVDFERKQVYGRAIQTSGAASLTCVYWDLLRKNETGLREKEKHTFLSIYKEDTPQQEGLKEQSKKFLYEYSDQVYCWDTDQEDIVKYLQ